MSASTGATYYRPTSGENIGTWNVFPVDGPTRHGVPWEELPTEVQTMIRERFAS